MDAALDRAIIGAPEFSTNTTFKFFLVNTIHIHHLDSKMPNFFCTFPPFLTEAPNHFDCRFGGLGGGLERAWEPGCRVWRKATGKSTKGGGARNTPRQSYWPKRSISDRQEKKTNKAHYSTIKATSPKWPWWRPLFSKFPWSGPLYPKLSMIKAKARLPQFDFRELSLGELLCWKGGEKKPVLAYLVLLDWNVAEEDNCKAIHIKFWLSLSKCDQWECWHIPFKGFTTNHQQNKGTKVQARSYSGHHATTTPCDCRRGCPWCPGYCTCAFSLMSWLVKKNPPPK